MQPFNKSKLAFAFGMSVTISILVFCMAGVTAPSRLLPVHSLGVLQSLWLGSRSKRIHERMLEVDDPTLDNLRKAGMFKICVADELATTQEHDERREIFPALLEDE